MKSFNAIPGCAFAVAMALVMASAAQAQQDPWSESYRLEKAGRHADAQALVEPLATRQSPHEFALLRSGWLLYLQGRYREAEERYLRAAEVNPRSVEAWRGAMLPQMALFKWSDALKSGQRVTAANSWDYIANIRIMICEEAMSRWGDLARHAAAMSARYPSDATVLVYGARAAVAMRDRRKAREMYAQVIERIPGHVEATKFIESDP